MLAVWFFDTGFPLTALARIYLQSRVNRDFQTYFPLRNHSEREKTGYDEKASKTERNLRAILSPFPSLLTLLYWLKSKIALISHCWSTRRWEIARPELE